MTVELIEVNLLPAEYRVRKRAIRVQREILYPLLIAVAAGVTLWVVTLTVDNQIRAVRNEIETIDVKIEQNRHIEREIQTLAADKRVIVEKIMALERINVNRARWVRLLEVFCRCLPEYTWLVDITEADAPAPSLQVEGRTYSFPEVATYMTKLKESAYIASVDLSSIEQTDEKNRVFSFKFTCAVDPNAGLENLAKAPVGAGQ